jgi:hypothetical protein
MRAREATTVGWLQANERRSEGAKEPQCEWHKGNVVEGSEVRCGLCRELKEAHAVAKECSEGQRSSHVNNALWSRSELAGRPSQRRISDSDWPSSVRCPTESSFLGSRIGPHRINIDLRMQNCRD